MLDTIHGNILKLEYLPIWSIKSLQKCTTWTNFPGSSENKSKIRNVKQISKHTGVHRPPSERHCLVKVVSGGIYHTLGECDLG